MFFTSILRWKHKAAIVFDGTNPLGWTDLDLSAVVGKRHALVMLKIENTGSSSDIYYLRTNGETQEVAFDETKSAGNNIVSVNIGCIVNIVIETDTNGIIEWHSAIAPAKTAKIYVMGWL